MRSSKYRFLRFVECLLFSTCLTVTSLVMVCGVTDTYPVNLVAPKVHSHQERPYIGLMPLDKAIAGIYQMPVETFRLQIKDSPKFERLHQEYKANRRFQLDRLPPFPTPICQLGWRNISGKGWYYYTSKKGDGLFFPEAIVFYATVGAVVVPFLMGILIIVREWQLDAMFNSTHEAIVQKEQLNLRARSTSLWVVEAKAKGCRSA